MERLILIALVIGCCLVLSFLFSGMEAGVLALSRLRIRQMMRAGSPSAQVLYGYLESPENFLWTILVGNTLANLIAVGLVVTLLHEWLGRWPTLLLLSLAVIVFLFYAFCELLPKMLFRMFPNRLSLAMAGPFGAIHLALSPLVWLMNKLSSGMLHWTGGRIFTGHLFGSREEMRLFMQESAHGFTSEERMMINRVLDLQNSNVGSFATSMDKVVTITTQTTMAEALKIAREKNLSRLPVWRAEGGNRRIVGIVSLRSVLYRADIDPSRPAADYVNPALYIPAEMRVEAALKRMQRSGQRLGIVLNAEQREIGIVSLQDILKVIFGEVRL
jgi:CBS domain containing-hemolysin-like protein